MRRQTRIAILAGLAVVAVAVVVLAVALGGDDTEKDGGGTTSTIYDSVPQDGEWLGSADAPLVVEEFADLQCPFCRQYSTDVLPALVDEYVKTGKIRMRLRLMTFIGPDSEKAARAAYAASLQDRMWHFADRFYAMQRPENSGYVTDDFLREVASGIPGLDVDRMLDDRDDPKVTELLAAVDPDATRNGVDSTPAFLAGPKGGRLRKILPEQLDVTSFRTVFDAALKLEQG